MTWQIINNYLVRECIFKNFQEAMNFAVLVGELAEKIQHHPEITVSWGKVIIKITTHDENNKITDKDYLLASQIDKL
jgi:4a-hydroxytetrahydrobiopterin dehydratase